MKNVAESGKSEAFYRCWTRKEAFIKAKGLGFRLPLDQFQVSLLKDEPAELIQTKWDMEEKVKWKLIHIPMKDDYMAALVINSNIDHDLKFYEFNSAKL